MSETKPVCEVLAGSFGYPESPMNPPPAEKFKNVISFALTTGCSHGVCTFCNMYEKGGYSVKPLREFKNHVDEVVGLYARNRNILGEPDRIFVGAGNALSVNTGDLIEASQYALQEVKRLDGGEVPRRLAMYGSVGDILDKGREEMRELRCGGTCGRCSIGRLGTRRGLEVLYLGLETGSDNVLKVAGKGYNHDQAMEAAAILDYSRIRPSVMIMPGLGGETFSEEHVNDTVEVINAMQPEWVTFIGLKIWPGTPYQKWIEREEEGNRNRRLNDREIAEQTAQMIERITVTTKVGLHGDDIHTYGSNPVVMGSVEIYDNWDARELARNLRKKAQQVA